MAGGVHCGRGFRCARRHDWPGDAEFRLPLLIGLFGFVAMQAVILNKAMSLIVVLTALPARLVAVPYNELAPHWPVIVNLLAGSLLGAWPDVMLYRVLAVLLILIAVALAWSHFGDLGALAGRIISGLLLGVVPDAVLIPLLVALLGLSAVKVWRHD